MIGHLAPNGQRHPGGKSSCRDCNGTTNRGYGWNHQKKRRGIVQTIEAGMINCVRCGKRIQRGDNWDLGHTRDRLGYTGPEHAACNRSAGAA